MLYEEPDYCAVRHHVLCSTLISVAPSSCGLFRSGPDAPMSAFLQVDTLFSLGSTYLFAQLVEHMDKQPQLYTNKTSYKQLFNEMIEAIDWCHRDGAGAADASPVLTPISIHRPLHPHCALAGSLKSAVAENPGKFIFKDASLVPMFELLRSSGKRVFLVTNSLWDYTNVVMNYLCEGRTGADRNLEWLRHFDVVRSAHADTAAEAHESLPRSGGRRRVTCMRARPSVWVWWRCVADRGGGSEAELFRRRERD